LIDDYINSLRTIIDVIQKHGLDTEHAHYYAINKNHLIEFDTLGVEGIMGGTGQKEIY